MAITLTGNLAQRVLGMLRRAVIILGIPQIDSVDLIPGILGNLGLGNGGLTVVVVVRGSLKIPLIAMDTSGDHGTVEAVRHIGIALALLAYLTGVVKAGPTPSITQAATSCTVKWATIFPHAGAHQAVALLRLTVRKQDDHLVVRGAVLQQCPGCHNAGLDVSAAAGFDLIDRATDGIYIVGKPAVHSIVMPGNNRIKGICIPIEADNRHTVSCPAGRIQYLLGKLDGLALGCVNAFVPLHGAGSINDQDNV